MLHRLRQLDLGQWRGSLAAVMLARLLWGAWAAFISAMAPDNALEISTPVWPAQVLNGAWWQRVLVSPWMRHDYEYYERIVSPGYRTDDGTASFHPLFPMLAKPFFWLSGNADASLLLVSTLGAWASTLMIARYARRFHARAGDEQFPSVVGWFFLLNPVGWIVLAPYTEGTFLTLAIGSLWAMRERRFWLAAALGAGATLTRQQGVLLLAPLLWQLWRPSPPEEAEPGARAQVLASRARWTDWLCLGAIPLAYASFSLYRVLILREDLDSERGVAGYFASWLVSPSTRLVVPGSGLAPPWKPLIETIRLLPVTPYPIHLLIDAIGGWALVALLIRGWKRLHESEQWWCASVILASTCFYSAPYMSFPRHMMLAFPLPILAARWAREHGRTRLLLEAMLLANLLLCAGFVRHSWVP